MLTGDEAAGMVGSIAEAFPKAGYQRCTVHFYRNVLAEVPKSKRSQVAATGPTRPSPWAAGHSHPSPGPGRRDPASP